MLLIAAENVDPYEIFSRSRAAITAAQYPERLDYTITVTGLAGTIRETNRYRASCRPDQGSIFVASISTEEAALPPPVVHGFNFRFIAQIAGGLGSHVGTVSVPVGPPSPSPDLIGVPLLSPTYMFGLQYEAKSSDPAQESSPALNLPVITTVSSQKRDYEVALIDTPLIDGVATYHLRLTPLRDPKNNRLRELWIGMTDYLPRKAVVEGNFTLTPFVTIPWTITFSIASGAPVIESEVADATLYMAHKRVVRDASIAFDDIAERRSIVGRPLIEPDITETTLVEPGHE